MALIELAITWDESRREDVKAYVEAWLRHEVAHSDDIVPHEHPELSDTEVMLPLMAKNFVYNLILGALDANRTKVSYKCVIAALNSFKGAHYDADAKMRLNFDTEIDAMKKHVLDVFQGQRKQFEPFRKAVLLVQPPPRQRTQWIVIPA